MNFANSLPLRIVIVGHVDHGKSTLVGRLLHDAGALPEGKYEQIQNVCRTRGVPFEWAFLMDALQAERDQNITIDVSQIAFKSAQERPCILIDAPGHKEFLKNMITGAARADAAILLIAANEGIQEQSCRHGYLLSLLGLKQVVVAVNKMDLIPPAEREKTFRMIEAEYRQFLKKVDVDPQYFIPISARNGINITRGEQHREQEKAFALEWYNGPTILETLDSFESPKSLNHLPLRLPIQDIYRFDARRILAGRIESGSLQVGDELVFSPNNKTAKIATIEVWPSNPKTGPTSAQFAVAGQSVGITLKEQIFVERGHLASLRQDAPIETTHFKARIFWLSENELTLGSKYTLKIATQSLECEVAAIEQVIDATTLQSQAATTEETSATTLTVKRHEVAELSLRTRLPVVLDNHERIPNLGRFVLLSGHEIGGGGVIYGGTYTDRSIIKSDHITWSEGQVTAAARAKRNGHRGAVVWLTGLSGSGKSTIANHLERELFQRHMHAYVLDGDNIRHGLNSNLGFSPEDRLENIRRIAEVARLMADCGVITITSFISPYRQDRARAREIALEGGCEFIEVYVNAPLAVCEERDPKQLYQKARAGEIKQFTGIDAPYEEPDSPEITLTTASQTIDESVNALLEELLPQLKDLRLKS